VSEGKPIGYLILEFYELTPTHDARSEHAVLHGFIPVDVPIGLNAAVRAEKLAAEAMEIRDH